MVLNFSFPAKVSILPSSFSEPRSRNLSFPLAHSSRKKERRWPLVIRFWKGSIHSTIVFPVFAHATLAAVVVYVNQQITSNFSLPSSIIPSISIVVGLMLVFRNQVAWTRYWGGRNHLNTVTTSIRCLARQFLVLTPAPRPPLHTSPSGESMLPARSRNVSMSRESTALNDEAHEYISDDEEAKVVETIKILIAMLYTIKNHLRTEWGVALSPGTSLTRDGQETIRSEYQHLLPAGLKGYEHRGLALTLELATFIEKFISVGVKKQWFHNAASGAMINHLDALTSAYGSMEVIRLVPIPVAHLIHHKQTLALFCGILPFAMAAETGIWAVPLTAFVSFTLYGIEGIAASYEDPFGRQPKTDINVDEIVEDARQEVEVLLDAWRSQGRVGDKEGLFWGRRGGKSRAGSVSFGGARDRGRDLDGAPRSGVKFVISDLSDTPDMDGVAGLEEGEVVMYRDDMGPATGGTGELSHRSLLGRLSPKSTRSLGREGSNEEYFRGV